MDIFNMANLVKHLERDGYVSIKLNKRGRMAPTTAITQREVDAMLTDGYFVEFDNKFAELSQVLWHLTDYVVEIGDPGGYTTLYINKEKTRQRRRLQAMKTTGFAA